MVAVGGVSSYQHPGGEPGQLFVTVPDPHLYPAHELIALYHSRWEIELGYDEVKTHLLERKECLRSKKLEGVEQEVWGLLLLYNLVRREMVLAAREHGVAPERISFRSSAVDSHILGDILDGQTLALIDDAVCAGARLAPACALLGFSPRTLQRWLNQDEGDRRRGPTTVPDHQLTPAETDRIVALANSPALRNLSPERAVASLADSGDYVCSESSLRRVLKRRAQSAHRQRNKPATAASKPRAYAAREPLRVLTWDITYLRQARVRGGFFYLYLPGCLESAHRRL